MTSFWGSNSTRSTPEPLSFGPSIVQIALFRPIQGFQLCPGAGRMCTEWRSDCCERGPRLALERKPTPRVASGYAAPAQISPATLKSCNCELPAPSGARHLKGADGTRPTHLNRPNAGRFTLLPWSEWGLGEPPPNRTPSRAHSRQIWRGAGTRLADGVTLRDALPHLAAGSLRA